MAFSHLVPSQRAPTISLPAIPHCLLCKHPKQSQGALLSPAELMHIFETHHLHSLWRSLRYQDSAFQLQLHHQGTTHQLQVHLASQVLLWLHFKRSVFVPTLKLPLCYENGVAAWFSCVNKISRFPWIPSHVWHVFDWLYNLEKRLQSLFNVASYSLNFDLVFIGRGLKSLFFEIVSVRGLMHRMSRSRSCHTALSWTTHFCWRNKYMQKL